MRTVSGLIVFALAAMLWPGQVAAESKNPPPKTYLERIRAGEVLKVGLAGHTPPFSARVGGKLDGFDVALAQALAEALGARFTFVELEMKERIPSLMSGKVDLLIADMTVTARRAGKVSFSKPYMTITQAALVDRRRIPKVTREGQVYEVPMKSYFDLKKISGLRVAVHARTEVERQARRYFPDAKVVPRATIPDVLKALWDKKVDAVVHDSPLIEFYYRHHRGQARRLRALLGSATTERLGIVVREGDHTFLRLLDVFVQEMQDRGELDRLYDKYVRDDTWLTKTEEK